MRSGTCDEQPTDGNVPPEKLSMNFRKIEWREWWLWSAMVSVTLLLTVGLASFLLPGLSRNEDNFSTFLFMPQIVRGLLALVLIFDIYTLHQQLQINRIRRRLVQRKNSLDSLAKMPPT